MDYWKEKIWRFSQLLFVLLALSPFSHIEASAAMYSFNSANIFGNSYTTPQSFGNVFTPLKDIIITSLGVFDYHDDGLWESHDVGIFNNSGDLLVSAVVAAGADTRSENHFRYVDIAPLTLTAGQAYTVANVFLTHADMVGYADIEDLQVSPDISLPGFAARFVFQRGRGAGLQFPANMIGASSEFYIGPNFQFTTALPATNAPIPTDPALTPNFGPILPGPAPIAPVHTPIPGAVWLLGTGLVGLMGLRRKLKG